MGKIFYKYRPINQHTIDSINENFVYFAHPQQLDDPFYAKIQLDFSTTSEQKIDCMDRFGLEKNVLFSKLISEELDNSNLEERNEKKINKIFNTIFLFCVSEIYNSKLMWADYADANKGICIGYESLDLSPKNLLLLNTNLKNNHVRILKNKVSVLFDKVSYDLDTNEKFNPFIHNTEAILHHFNRKTKVWSYEKESRGFFIDDNLYNQRIKLYPNTIREIIFGLNVENKNIVDFMNRIKVNTNLINFYKINKPSDGINLVRVKLSLDEYIK